MQLDTILANRYQIRAQLSHKAGRQTFLAQDLQSEALIVIKILRFDADFQWDDLKLFQREVTTLQQLNHPAIPQYLDYFEVDESDTRGFALVQTYINAPSLETEIRAGRKFSEAEAIELADRLLSILTYLHSQLPPVIHRDLKPSNILLTNRSGNSIGDVYLVDFGSVQNVASKDGGTITIVGSYGYIPLEQFGGKTTTASDLYSLGMTIIYLITGTHPSELPQINGQVKFTAEISNQLHRWLEKMTQPHLDKRFDSAKLAQIALNSEDGSHGDFIHLKPANSKVQLYRDREKLEARFFDFGTITNLCQIGFGLVCFLIIFCSPWWLYAKLGFVGIGIYILLWIALITIGNLFEKYSFELIRILSIDLEKQTIKMGVDRHKTGRIKWKQTASWRDARDINIVYKPGYIFDKYIDANGKVFSKTEVKMYPQLSINVQGDIKTEIDLTLTLKSELLPEADLYWLAQELSDFLELELQVIYPTPQLPQPSG